MQEKTFPIACVVLASGLGHRFGGNKLLAQLGTAPLVQHILDVTENIFLERIVITRHNAIKKLCDRQHISCVLHNEPYLNDTVRLGLEYIQKHTTTQNKPLGILFATADQPLLKPSTLQKLCASFMQQPKKIHRLYYKDTPGNPVIFPISMTQELKALPQDKGGSVLAKKYPELVVKIQVQDEYELFDIDTKEDLHQLEH